ncbi:hypothetical protein K435DRAFT_812720 [Dendrothele bispora CBS 962.96]|uniref:Uncharacterized protein n=1 Tax=Dendrothele bispora (strain CBS 962.96) TaxID=1314807 RepID=A0A4S8KNC5_DENBC|nr:hypothetical protein K435DRAFT_812720 [Dendrothele bispora CBS 962.96]
MHSDTNDPPPDGDFTINDPELAPDDAPEPGNDPAEDVDVDSTMEGSGFDESAVPSSSSTPTRSASRFDIDNWKSQNIVRVEDDLFRFEHNRFVYFVTAFEVRLFLAQNEKLKQHGTLGAVVPSPTYTAFAEAFNAEDTPFKLCYYDPDHDRSTGRSTPLLYRSTPNPPKGMLRLASHQCVRDEILFPGNTSVAQAELDSLRAIATHNQVTHHKFMARKTLNKMNKQRGKGDPIVVKKNKKSDSDSFKF